MDSHGIKRSASTERHFEGSNRAQDGHWDSSRYRGRQEPPWDRPDGALYSDRERLRDRSDQEMYHHHQHRRGHLHYDHTAPVGRLGPPPFDRRFEGRQYEHHRRTSLDGFQLDVRGKGAIEDPKIIIMENVKYIPPAEDGRQAPWTTNQPQQPPSSDSLLRVGLDQQPRHLDKEEVLSRLTPVGYLLFMIIMMLLFDPHELHNVFKMILNCVLLAVRRF